MPEPTTTWVHHPRLLKVLGTRLESGFEQEKQFETEAEAEAAAAEARQTLGPCGVVPIICKVGLITVTQFYVVPLEEE